MFPLGLAGTKKRPFPMERVEFTLNTSTGNQDITLDASISKGKTPIAAMLVMTIGNTDSFVRYSVGFFDGTTSNVLAVAAQNGVTTTNTVTRGATDECVMQINESGGVVAEAAGVALIENGVRINIGATDAQAYPGTCYLFFDDDGSAKVSTFASHATENSTVTVTPGIATDALVTMGPRPNDNWFDDAAHAGAAASLGFALSGGGQCAVHWFDADGQGTSSVGEYVASANGTVTNSNDGRRLEYDNFTATQFDATTRGGNGGGTVAYLALEMPNAQFWTGVIDTPITTTNQSYTDAGFPVQSLLAVPTIKETVDAETMDRTAECFGVGAATKRGVASVTVASEDNVSTSDVESHFNTSTIRAAGADDHNESEADSFTTIPTGFKLNFTTAHSTAQKWPVLAIGRA